MREGWVSILIISLVLFERRIEKLKGNMLGLEDLVFIVNVVGWVML